VLLRSAASIDTTMVAPCSTLPEPVCLVAEDFSCGALYFTHDVLASLPEEEAARAIARLPKPTRFVVTDTNYSPGCGELVLKKGNKIRGPQAFFGDGSTSLRVVCMHPDVDDMVNANRLLGATMVYRRNKGALLPDMSRCSLKRSRSTQDVTTVLLSESGERHAKRLNACRAHSADAPHDANSGDEDDSEDHFGLFRRAYSPPPNPWDAEPGSSGPYSPTYTPTSPSYSPTSPEHQPFNSGCQPSSPMYSPTSPMRDMM
jgi:hypothetical protein